MVPPGAAMAARGVLSELRLNLDLNIGPLAHPWPFAPSFFQAESHSSDIFTSRILGLHFMRDTMMMV